MLTNEQNKPYRRSLIGSHLDAYGFTLKAIEESAGWSGDTHECCGF